MKKLIKNFGRSVYYFNAVAEIAMISIIFVVALKGIFSTGNIPIDDHATIVPIIIISALVLYITGSYRITEKRSIELAITGAFAIILSDLAAVAIIRVYSFIWFDIIDFILTYIMQILAYSVWIVLARTVYKAFKKPQKTIVVCYDIENSDSYVKKIQGYSDKFEIVKIISYEDADLYYSICQSEAVFMLDLSSKKREKSSIFKYRVVI